MTAMTHRKWVPICLLASTTVAIAGIWRLCKVLSDTLDRTPMHPPRVLPLRR